MASARQTVKEFIQEEAKRHMEVSIRRTYCIVLDGMRSTNIILFYYCLKVHVW